MRRKSSYIKLCMAVLLLVVSLVAAFWEYEVDTPSENWSKSITTHSSDGTLTKYQMMVYVDRPIIRSDQSCITYLRIKNAGSRPLELKGTYITNHHYVNGELYGEEIGDWQIPGSPLKLLPHEIKDVSLSHAIKAHYRWPPQMTTVGTRGFQFCGFGLQTNTVTVYVLPSRPFMLVLAAIAIFAVWRTWLGVRDLTNS